MPQPQEITHCHNQRPIYEIENREVTSWERPGEVAGRIPSNYKPHTYYPVVFDIETSAELGQRPILLIAYDTLEDKAILMHSVGYQGYDIGIQKFKRMFEKYGKEAAEYRVYNLSISNFEKHILRPISQWNKQAEERKDPVRKSLVAHNAAFDIPIMGTPNDELLNNPRIGDQYEQSVQYKQVKMVGHRAGQFGQIYTFLDSAKSFEPMFIPVGDTMVAAESIWVSKKLSYACEDMGIDIEISEAEEHGKLTDEYVEYCINDVIGTLKLYLAITNRIREMFGDLPIEHIYSTASIGKFVLRNMNYHRVGYEEKAVDIIAKSYFGGRTDAHKTGEIIPNLRYTDILSQYPTVSELTNVWSFMQAEEVTINQIDVSELPTELDMTDPDSWEEVANYYVKINPKGATLPVRTPHLEDTTKVVTSQVESRHDLTYHYMDIVGSKLIDGENDIEILAAWEVSKSGMQDLKATEVAGVEIGSDDNVMAKCIESRKEIQKAAGEKNSKTLSLKITANSLYGVTAERIVKDKDGEKHDYASDRGFYNPHVAATITAAGRLMLALGERIALDNDGEMLYCDTDSLILTENCCEAVIDGFKDLNPYSGYAGELDVLENEFDSVGNLYATGTKKYVFFDDNGTCLEAKEHGLGNYENLRGKETIKRLWATIIYYDLGHNPLNIEILYDGDLNKNVYWSFSASTVSMRQMIDDFTDDYIRYGDWIQSTLSYDNNIRYVALNLMEKEGSETVLRIETEGETVISAETVTKAEMDADGRLKTVRDVVNKFIQDGATDTERPSVEVVEMKPVTKEATSRTDIFITNLEREFKSNMEPATNWLFGESISEAEAD